MRSKKLLLLGTAVSAVFVASATLAQQKQAVTQANFAYDVTREAVVRGTVTSYTAASEVAPIGPHAMIQTSSGLVDVHLGNAQYMKQNDLFLAPGDSVSIVGMSQSLGTGTVFLARIVRKGNQTVTLRNLNGIPLVAKPAANAKPRSIAGGVR